MNEFQIQYNIYLLEEKKKKEIEEEMYDDYAIEDVANNSLLLDDGDIIASIKFKDGSFCHIEICGDKSVFYKDEEYRSRQHYPEELVELLKSKNPADADKWSFWDNNWIEFHYWDKDGKFLTDGMDIIDDEFDGTRESIRKLMLNYVEEIDKEVKQKEEK